MKPFYQPKIITSALLAGLLASLSPGAARAGDTIFVANNHDGTIGAYTTSGATVNAALISGLNFAVGVAVSGSDLFLSNAVTIGEYTTSGATVNAALISGLSGPGGIALSGSDLFVANGATIGEYTTSGATVNPALISGLSGPIGIALSGSDLFVANATSGTIGQYTTAGAPVNVPLISGLMNAPVGIAISGSSVPEASTWAMALTGFAALAFAGFRRAPSRAASA